MHSISHKGMVYGWAVIVVRVKPVGMKEGGREGKYGWMDGLYGVA